MAARREQPTYLLGDVQRLVKLARIGDRVLERTQQDCGIDNFSNVATFIHKRIKTLAMVDFVRSEEQVYVHPILADIYVASDWRRPLFIKFYFEHGRVTITSCHKLDKDIQRADGMIVKAT
jgi:Motility quorum-sensing regulator, toxin of MqsA